MIFSLANGEITLVQPCKILQDIDSHYIQCLSKIFPEKCVSQLWKSYFVLTHKMSEIIMLKSRKISDKNPKFTVWFVLPRDQRYLGFCLRFMGR